MEEHTVPVRYLVLPVLLPLGQGVLLKETVCADDQHRSCSLKAHAALDADDGVTHVAVTAYCICGANLLNLLDGLDAVIELLAVYGYELALLKAQAQNLRSFLGGMLKICALGQTLFAVQDLTAAD